MRLTRCLSPDGARRLDAALWRGAQSELRSTSTVRASARRWSKTSPTGDPEPEPHGRHRAEFGQFGVPRVLLSAYRHELARR